MSNASIADKLEQLITDKATLVTNLNAKNVTASDEETFTSLVAKVADITGGGGGGGLSLPSNMSMGTFVVTTRTQTQQVIPHGLGVAPTFALILADECNATGTAWDILGGYTAFDLNGGVSLVGTASRTYARGSNGVRREIAVANTNSPVTTDATNIYISGSGNYYFNPNMTYRWFAWAEVTT